MHLPDEVLDQYIGMMLRQERCRNGNIGGGTITNTGRICMRSVGWTATNDDGDAQGLDFQIHNPISRGRGLRRLQIQNLFSGTRANQ